MIIAVKVQWIGVALLSLTLCGCSGNKQEQTARANPVAEPAANPEPAPDSRPVIVAFGDSLTAGYGVEQGKSYPDDLQRLIDAAGYKYRVVNLGVSGDTTTDGIQRLPDVVAAKPVIVILEFGGNDGLRGLPVSTTRANQIQMVEALQKAGIQILLAGMTLPPNYGADYIRSFEQVYVDVARQFHLARIPFLLEGVGGHPDLVQSDGIHPTAEGCRIVSVNVMNNLKPLLRR
jgi:acyl-CoA thioesterase-1